MGNSLADQLLKAGIGTKQQAQKANKQKRKKQRQQRQQKAPVVDEITLAQQQKEAEKVARDQALNQEIKAAAEQKAIQAQIKQLIELNQHALEDKAEQAYNFTDGSKVQKLWLTPEQHQALSQGQTAIVKHSEAYALIPASVARKIQERDAAAVLVLNDADNAASDEDDPYADYQVPDDLMW